MKKIFNKTLLLDVGISLVGSVFYALAVVLFSSPNNIAPGGITGLATLFNYLWKLPIGLMTVLMNIPLFLLGWKRLGRHFLIFSIVGVGLSSIFTDILQPLIGQYAYVSDGEMLLVCLFGGACMGLGLGLILSRGGTTGGTDILSRLLEQRFPHISVGTLMALLDGVVIVFSAVVYKQVRSPMYAVVFAVVCAVVTDRIVYGGERGKVAMIFSKEHHGEISRRIISELGRSVTVMQGTGAYSGQDQPVMLCAVKRHEIAALKRLAFELDPKAFFIVLTSDEVLGYGWKNPEGRK